MFRIPTPNGFLGLLEQLINFFERTHFLSYLRKIPINRLGAMYADFLLASIIPNFMRIC